MPHEHVPPKRTQRRKAAPAEARRLESAERTRGRTPARAGVRLPTVASALAEFLGAPPKLAGRPPIRRPTGRGVSSPNPFQRAVLRLIQRARPQSRAVPGSRVPRRKAR